MNIEVTLTDASFEYFKYIYDDRHNWNGTPLFQGGPSERGYLMDFKKKGLLTTSIDEEDGTVWIHFTELGNEFAKKHNID